MLETRENRAGFAVSRPALPAVHHTEATRWLTPHREVHYANYYYFNSGGKMLSTFRRSLAAGPPTRCLLSGEHGMGD